MIATPKEIQVATDRIEEEKKEKKRLREEKKELKEKRIRDERNEKLVAPFILLITLAISALIVLIKSISN